MPERQLGAKTKAQEIIQITKSTPSGASFSVRFSGGFEKEWLPVNDESLARQEKKVGSTLLPHSHGMKDLLKIVCASLSRQQANNRNLACKRLSHGHAEAD